NLIRLDNHIDIVQCVCTVGITKIYIFYFKFTSNNARTNRTTMFCFVRSMDDIKISFRVNHGVIHIIINTMQLSDWSRNIVEQQDMEHNITDTHLTIKYQICSNNDDKNYTNLL